MCPWALGSCAAVFCVCVWGVISSFGQIISLLRSLNKYHGIRHSSSKMNYNDKCKANLITEKLTRQREKSPYAFLES